MPRERRTSYLALAILMAGILLLASLLLRWSRTAGRARRTQPSVALRCRRRHALAQLGHFRTARRLAAANNAGWVREDFAWGLIQPRPDSFDWTATDRIVGNLGDRKINVLGIIAYGASWATATQRRRRKRHILLSARPRQILHLRQDAGQPLQARSTRLGSMERARQRPFLEARPQPQRICGPPQDRLPRHQGRRPQRQSTSPAASPATRYPTSKRCWRQERAVRSTSSPCTRMRCPSIPAIRQGTHREQPRSAQGAGR